MNFEPVNNYLYVKVIEKEEEKTGVLVPEGYKVAKSPYQVVEIIRSSALNVGSVSMNPRPSPITPRRKGSSRFGCLEFDDKVSLLCAGDANHDLAVFFLIHQDHIAMINITLDQLAAACATGAAFTRTDRFDAIITKRFKNGPVSRDGNRGLKICHRYLKGLVIFADGINGFEIFEMDATFWPMT